MSHSCGRGSPSRLHKAKREEETRENAATMNDFDWTKSGHFEDRFCLLAETERATTI
jgi:hypothetical protein